MAQGPFDGDIDLGGPLVEATFTSPSKPWSKRDAEVFWGILLTFAVFTALGIAWIVLSSWRLV